MHTALAGFIFLSGLRRVRTDHAAILTYTEPASAVVFAAAVPRRGAHDRHGHRRRDGRRGRSARGTARREGRRVRAGGRGGRGAEESEESEDTD